MYKPDYDEPDASGFYDNRWYKLRYHEAQQQYWTSSSRFNVVPAGRRSGKTELAKRKTVRISFSTPSSGGSQYPDPRYFLGAPTRDQAKRIFWNDLKLFVPPKFRSKKPSESDLILYTNAGAEIHVVGMDKPERIEGPPWDGGVLDEYGNMKERTWREHVRPALSDRRGWCDMIGVPEGRNHYYRKYRGALEDTTGAWRAHHWISAGILPPGEIEEAKRDLDKLTFQQEYEASFINFTGRTYWVFEEKLHYGKLFQNYNPKNDLLFMFDFNVSPGVAAVGQEMKLPTKDENFGTALIGEVWIPRNSNTIYVCNRLIKDWGKHKGIIVCYGDATGGARGSAKILGSDWQLIKETLWAHFGRDRVFFKVPLSNPRERDRVNAVNSRLQSVSSKVRMMVDAEKCPHIIDDFEGVTCVEGGSGEIDDKADPNLTHLSSAIGYYVYKEYPVKKRYESSGQKYWK